MRQLSNDITNSMEYVSIVLEKSHCIIWDLEQDSYLNEKAIKGIGEYVRIHNFISIADDYISEARKHVDHAVEVSIQGGASNG